MTLLGHISRLSKVNPKVTFMDRMKSFKRLKPSTGASKNTPPRCGKAQKPQEIPDIYWMGKVEEARKLFHHSYAGHTKGLEPFLPDLQVHASSRVNQMVLAFNDFGIQVEENPWEDMAPAPPSGVKRYRNYLKTMFPRGREALRTTAGNTRIQELEATIEGSALEGNVEGNHEENPEHPRQEKSCNFRQCRQAL
ncbi:uncharacterized protein ACIGJ3_004008 [Trichechus inunguis]